MSALNVDGCIEKLCQAEILPEPLVKVLCNKLKEQLVTESNVQHVKSPVTIVGDIHGQFFDLIELFRVGGKSPDTNYLFLGDYVDRGYHSVETILLILCLKLRWPSRVTILRGNHESRQISQVYGFYEECVRKYGSADVWKTLTDLFDFFTIAAVVDNSVFCVHGGLSPATKTIDQIRALNRFQEIPHEGAITDLMWSDPDAAHEGFNVSARGAGYTFGMDVTHKFLRENSVSHIVRAHQLCMDGYQILWDCLSTVWSAPNYCYRCGNVASILEVSEGLQRHYNTFTASPDSNKKYFADLTARMPDYFL